MPNGIIDLIITNIAMPLSLTKAHFTVLIGILMMPLWYFPAVWIIKKRNIDIFQDQDVSNEDVIKSAVNDDSDVKHFISGLGGQDNIETVGNCFTRLRVQVKNPELIDKSEIEKGKQTGVVINGNNVQIIIGMHVETYKEKMCDVLGLEA
jgi:PTS system arbutin-like IIC component